jgi:hypothetical protein
MKFRYIAAVTLATVASMAAAQTAPAKPAPAKAAAAETKLQFFPGLPYRTGPYAPNGVPWANGYSDYLKLVNAKGGINGVKILYEECETGYDTARGVECYERLKDKHGGATVFQPLSTGITFALTEKAPGDKIPLITAGYGRSESQDGTVFKWNFPLAGTYWLAADALVQTIAKKEGGLDKLKGKKIALVYHDSPYGKEPIPLLQDLATELAAAPVIGLDTEFLRERTYRAQLCLLQVATPARYVLVDPLDNPHLALLSPALAARQPVKILHAARQDLEVLYPALGPVTGLFDTQVAAGLVGLAAQIGYADLERKMSETGMNSQ